MNINQKNNTNLKKTSIIHNTNKCFGMIVQFNIIFIISNGKNRKEILFNSKNKKIIKSCY